MNNNNENNNDKAQTEDHAIVAAVIELYDIIILRRVYKRNDFTKGEIEAAKRVLAGLKSSPTEVDPARALARLAKNEKVAKQIVRSTIEGFENLKRRLWVKIRNLYLTENDIGTLNEEALIFSLYRDVQRADRAIRELSEEGTVRRTAVIAEKLVVKVSQEVATPVKGAA